MSTFLFPLVSLSSFLLSFYYSLLPDISLWWSCCPEKTFRAEWFTELQYEGPECSFYFSQPGHTRYSSAHSNYTLFTRFLTAALITAPVCHLSTSDLSSELVDSLQVRDQLRTEQDAMLLEVQDLTSLWTCSSEEGLCSRGFMCVNVVSHSGHLKHLRQSLRLLVGQANHCEECYSLRRLGHLVA